MTGRFRRDLGLFPLTMFGLGAILGAGWLFAPAKAAALAGPSEVLAWLLGGVMMLALALVYAELGSSFPTAGGVAKYPDYSHGPFLGFLTGWSVYISGVSYSALEAVASAQALSFVFPQLFSSATRSLSAEGVLLAFGLLLLFFLLNFAGVRRVGGFVSFLTAVKFLVPALTIAFVFTLHFNAANLETGGFAPEGFAGILMAVSAGGIVSAYSGFRQPVDMAAEAKHADRDVSRAIIYSMLISIVLYTLIGLAFVLAINWRLLGLNPGSWSALTALKSSPLIDAVALTGAFGLLTLMLLDSVYSPMGESSVYFTTSSRLGFAMAEQGYFPSFLYDLNDKGVPTKALLLSLILGAVFILPFPSWYQMVEVASGLTVITYASGPVSMIVLRGYGRKSHRLKGGRLIAPLAFAVASLLLYWFCWPYTLYVVVLAMLSLPLYMYYRFKNGKKGIRSATWFLVYLAGMLLISWLGSKQFGGLGLIQFPLDQVIVVVSSFGFYAWGLKSGTPSVPQSFVSSPLSGFEGFSPRSVGMPVFGLLSSELNSGAAGQHEGFYKPLASQP